MEQPKNGQVDQQIRRRPLRAVATPRTTNGFSHSHSFGLRDSQSSPKTRWSSYRATPNDYHDNSSANNVNGSDDTAPSATPKRGKAVAITTAWELPDLVRPLHRPRTRFIKQPRLLAHYPAVVEFVFNHRYAAGFQIQQQFNGYMPSARTSRYQLANLVDLGFLQRAPVRSTSPNFPAVFAATRQGIGLIRQTYADLGVEWHAVATEQPKQHGIAIDSILHELLLTEFDQAIRATIADRGDLSLLMYERRYFRADKQLRYPSHGEHHRVIPDAGFLVRQTSETSGRLPPEQTLQMNFVELDNGTHSAARLAAKYRAYTQWSISEEGQQYLQRLYWRYGGSSTPPNFRLLVIAHDKTDDHRRLVELFTLALDLPRIMRDRIWLTSVADLQIHQHQNAPVSAPIWRRVRDSRHWLPAFTGLSRDQRRPNFTRQKIFVANQLQRLTLHSLFPHAVRPLQADVRVAAE